MTALRLAHRVSVLLGRQMQVLTSDPFRLASPGEVTALASRLGAQRLLVSNVAAGQTARVSPDSLFLVTEWRTAYAALVAARTGLLSASRVAYVVQDYEPAFSPWSSSWGAAEMTYEAGFVHIVNSLPLARYFRERYGTAFVSDDHVVAPDLNAEKLSEVASLRRSPKAHEAVDVFFYARPKTARNLYPVGLGAARIAAGATKRSWRLVLAGQPISSAPKLPVPVVNMGRLAPGRYFEVMAECPVALSLMMSPHPSHPPLDWAVSGGVAVTNKFGTYRDDLHPRLRTAPTDPEELGLLLAGCIDESITGAYEPTAPLGRTLDSVARSMTGVRGFT